MLMVALSQQSGIPKLSLCRSFSIIGFHTLKNEALFQHLDVELDLIFQFAAGPPLPEQCRSFAMKMRIRLVIVIAPLAS